MSGLCAWTQTAECESQIADDPGGKVGSVGEQMLRIKTSAFVSSYMGVHTAASAVLQLLLEAPHTHTQADRHQGETHFKWTSRCSRPQCSEGGF